VTAVCVLTLPAVTENVVEVEPCGTVTVEGMLTSAGDELRLIVLPPLPAAEVNATVQVDPAAGLTATGVHEKPLRAGPGTIVTTLPLLEIGKVVAPAPAAISLMNCSWDDVSVVEVDTVREMVATTPFGMVVSFNPDTMHLEIPPLVAQVTDLFAPVDTGPAATVTDEKSTVE
jgi:hypothetical protein